MSDQPGQDVARVNGAYDLVTRSSEEFGKLLPAHVGEHKFTRWALTCLRDPKLSAPVTTKAGQTYPPILATDAGRLSVMSALMDCASLGLEPGRTYHLAPFKGTVTGIADYTGEIELMHRANRMSSVVLRLVHEADSFAMLGANVPPRHDPPEAGWFAERGPVTGGYAYQQAAPGVYSMVILMSEAEFLKHKAKANGNPIWDEWPEAMRLKTLAHQLKKLVPWSAEWVS